MSAQLPPRPIDATLTVTKAARLLGVHPNTVRAWSDAGRLRFYRINPRGDRRYRLGDLQRFLAVAERGAVAPPRSASAIGRRGFVARDHEGRLDAFQLETDDTIRHRRDLDLRIRNYIANSQRDVFRNLLGAERTFEFIRRDEDAHFQ